MLMKYNFTRLKNYVFIVLVCLSQTAYFAPLPRTLPPGVRCSQFPVPCTQYLVLRNADSAILKSLIPTPNPVPWPPSGWTVRSVLGWRGWQVVILWSCGVICGTTGRYLLLKSVGKSMCHIAPNKFPPSFNGQIVCPLWMAGPFKWSAFILFKLAPYSKGINQYTLIAYANLSEEYTSKHVMEVIR